MNIAIIGGGAAGFFLAVAIKEQNKSHSVTIYESGSVPLRKVKVSGGGRCNLSNTFASVKDLKEVYPRGHKLLKRLFKSFSPEDAQQWWRDHGVELVAQEDECIFPKSQNSQTIIDTLVITANRLGVRVLYNHPVDDVLALKQQFDAVCVTTGGMCSSCYQSLLSTTAVPNASEASVMQPLPSLFTFSIEDDSLRSLTGLVVEPAEMKIPATKFCSQGALLITHWGVSGPATLKLSSHAARHLAECDYKSPLSVNWLCCSQSEVEQHLLSFIDSNPKKELSSCPFPQLQNRLWLHLLRKCGLDSSSRYLDLSKKQKNRLVETLCNDIYTIVGRYKHKDEFVTCGGIALSSVNPNTLESKTIPGLYFAGEVLDIDGVTGGFNFQACWTTAMTVARALK